MSHHSHRRRTRIIYGLGALSVILFLSLLFVSIQLSLYAKELDKLMLLQRKQERELTRLRPRVAELEGEIGELVKGRLPGLRPLEFDKVIPIGEHYVRHLIFTLIGKEDERSYEYKLTLKNGNLTPAHPMVRIIFFDQLGIQVASSVVGDGDEGVQAVKVLEPGEVRSYTGTFHLRNDKEAKYFKIEVNPPAYP